MGDAKLKVFLMSLCDGIGGAVAAFGSRASVQARNIESPGALRAFTQAKLHWPTKRLAQEAGTHQHWCVASVAPSGKSFFLAGGPP